MLLQLALLLAAAPLSTVSQQDSPRDSLLDNQLDSQFEHYQLLLLSTALLLGPHRDSPLVRLLDSQLALSNLPDSLLASLLGSQLTARKHQPLGPQRDNKHLLDSSLASLL